MLAERNLLITFCPSAWVDIMAWKKRKGQIWRKVAGRIARTDMSGLNRISRVGAIRLHGGLGDVSLGSLHINGVSSRKKKGKGKKKT